ncbi:MAG: membrane dipeptidase [Ferruginibacter sp.]|nr:membrane dipeptidase [Cytophagales bacterium]
MNPGSIHLYDDEIRRIHRTKGLIGLIFYEPILAGKKGLFRSQEKWIELFVEPIQRTVRAVYDTGVANQHAVWDCLCIGSDFDGQLNPTDKFATSDQFPALKKFLKGALHEDRFHPYRNASEADALADQICFGNVVAFPKRSF